MVAWALQRDPLSSSIPEAAKLLFSRLATHHRQRNAHVRDEAAEVAEILNGVGVTPLFLKGGAHLLTGLYPDIGMRQLSDLDILVPQARIDECVAALAGRDIVQFPFDPHPRSHHHPALGRADLPVPIELHRRVVSHPHGDLLPSEEIISAGRSADRHGAQFAVPSPTHAAMHNIAHAQVNDHDCLYGRLDLRGLLDLALLTHAHDNGIDWDMINRRFVDAGRRYALEYHLHWAQRLGANIPSLGRTSPISKWLCRRASLQARQPKLLSLNVRALRPFVLLRRELSDSMLRRRLLRNVLVPAWWKRHFRMLIRT